MLADTKMTRDAARPSIGGLSLVFERAVLPFVERVRRDRSTFSLLEVGSRTAVQLSAVYNRSTLVALEPSWSDWTRSQLEARSNVAVVRNELHEVTVDALAHSNEFFDAQLLFSLAETAPFRRNFTGNRAIQLLDRYVGQLLSLARRTLLLLPGQHQQQRCQSSLGSWVHHSLHCEQVGGAASTSAGVARSGGGVAARLACSGKASGHHLDLHVDRVLAGAMPLRLGGLNTLCFLYLSFLHGSASP